MRQRAEPISMCRKRPFATHRRGRRPARAAACRIPCLILCVADVARTSCPSNARLQSKEYDRRRTRTPAQHGGPGARGPVRGALKLRLGLPPKTPALKTAIKAERVAFDLKRSLQRLEVKDVETITRRAPVLPEVRRGGKVVDPESLLRHENRHDKRLTGLPRRNTPRRSG